MALFAAFCGGTYVELSETIGADEAVNVMLYTRQVQGSAKQGTLYGTPGLLRVGTATEIVCRGWFEEDGLTLAVYGDTLYSVDTTDPLALAFTILDTIGTDGALVSIASNGKGGDQIGIVSAGDLYVLDTGTLLVSTVTLPFTGPGTLVFIDGYGLLNQLDSPVIWFSALEDLTTWDALDFFTRSGTSDNVVALAVNKSRVVALGSATSTLFYDSGDTDTPFLPFPESVTQWGLVSATALVINGDIGYALMRLGNGTPQMVRFGPELSPQVISTPPIDLLLEAGDVSDAEVFVYTQMNHTFACLTCPSLDAPNTFCFDVNEKLWHKRAGWSTLLGDFARWRARACVAINGYVYVGDYGTGAVYALDLNTYDDDGEILMALRRAPYLGSEAQWAFLDQVQLGIQAGVGNADASDPQVMLRISRDGASTWVDAGEASLGAVGEYDTRACWRMLGRVRQDLLVIEVRQSDAAKRVFGPGLWLRFSAGTGQL